MSCSLFCYCCCVITDELFIILLLLLLLLCYQPASQMQDGEQPQALAQVLLNSLTVSNSNISALPKNAMKFFCIMFRTETGLQAGLKILHFSISKKKKKILTKLNILTNVVTVVCCFLLGSSLLSGLHCHPQDESGTGKLVSRVP